VLAQQVVATGWQQATGAQDEHEDEQWLRRPHASAIDGDTASARNRPNRMATLFMEMLLLGAKKKFVVNRIICIRRK